MEDYTKKLCENLIKAGHKVTVITSSSKHGKTFENLNGVNINYLDNKEPGSYKGGFFKKSYKTFKKLDKVEMFDIVHFQSSAAIGFLTKRINIPMIITMHGTLKTETKLAKFYRKDGMLPLIFNTIKMYKRLIIHFLTLLTFIKSSYIIIPSEFSKNTFKMYVENKKLKVIYHGIENYTYSDEKQVAAKEKLGLKNKKVILCLSRIVEEKGIQTALDAFKKMQNLEESQEYVLVIAGDGPYKTQLERKVEIDKIQNVFFVGFISEKEKDQYYCAADLYINPELTIPAFGLVSIEAMARGTSVIATNHGATKEIIKDNNFLFTPGDSNDLEDKIIKFFNKPIEERTIINERFLKSQNERFTIKNMINQTLSLYKNAIKEKL
ncbi:glycosyltransferase family 4 protein [Neobacillus niacini]|uniref:glycosyltransferase family 4 protein n=1 Tax=Neobacillus niacini TaxID=86668 RepID=UPI003B01CC8E